ncbi:unnamed protein product [Adineta steineri]|uniref:Uncharacterized protein n=1 Tax=Adineta steineri TaxID=433720 RepID=A0A815DIP1_9BILA|nr:unnamed protein product [Adineta steineri]CAF3560278.1 unnamed protein product [Adineta steineri]
MVYKPQQQINDRRQSESYQQRTNINDHRQRYQTINTASIPPLMSVRSDINTTAKFISDEKVAIKNDNETHVIQIENESIKIDKRTITTPSSNSKRRSNKDQRCKNQQAPCHRNNYTRAIHYNNRYNYSNEYYQQQRSTNNKHSKRGGASITQYQQQRQLTFNGSGSNHNNFPHYSISDNNQKEGEE